MMMSAFGVLTGTMLLLATPTSGSWQNATIGSSERVIPCEVYLPHMEAIYDQILDNKTFAEKWEAERDYYTRVHHRNTFWRLTGTAGKVGIALRKTRRWCHNYYNVISYNYVVKREKGGSYSTWFLEKILVPYYRTKQLYHVMVEYGRMWPNSTYEYRRDFCTVNVGFWMQYFLRELLSALFGYQHALLARYYFAKVMFLIKLVSVWSFPFVGLSIACNYSIIKRMLKELHSSSLIYHQKETIADAAVYILACFAYIQVHQPLIQGACFFLNSAVGGHDIDMGMFSALKNFLGLSWITTRAQWYVIVFYNGIMQTLLIGDRTISLYFPIFYKDHCNETFAKRVVTGVALGCALLSVTEAVAAASLNIQPLNDNNKVMAKFALVRDIIFIVFHSVCLVAQVVFGVFLVAKLFKMYLAQRANEQRHGQSMSVFGACSLLFGTVALNVVMSVPVLLNLVLSCIMKYFQCCATLEWYQSVMPDRGVLWAARYAKSLYPFKGAFSFVLHMILSSGYRRETSTILSSAAGRAKSLASKYSSLSSISPVFSLSSSSEAKSSSGGASEGEKSGIIRDTKMPMFSRSK